MVLLKFQVCVSSYLFRYIEYLEHCGIVQGKDLNTFINPTPSALLGVPDAAKYLVDVASLDLALSGR